MSPSATRKLGLNVPAEMAEKLKSLSDRTMIPQSRLLRQALDLLFTHYDNLPQEPKPGRGRK